MVSRRQLLTGLSAMPVVGVLDRRQLVAVASATESSELPLSSSGRELLRRRYFPNIELTTSKGQKVKLYDDLLKNKIVVLNMMYTDCSAVCPTITDNLIRVREILRQEIDHDVFIYSLTVKPEEDTPGALDFYAQMHGVDDPQWLFLTGNPDEMDLLRHNLGFADPDPEIDRDRSRHSGMLRYGNEAMAIWGTCQGSAEPEWIAEEIGFAVPREFKRHPRVNE